jgi:hypothetical protein
MSEASRDARRKLGRGRPFLYPDDPMHQVSVWLPQSILDRYCAIATTQQVPLQRLLRTTLMRALTHSLN